MTTAEYICVWRISHKINFVTAAYPNFTQSERKSVGIIMAPIQIPEKSRTIRGQCKNILNVYTTRTKSSKMYELKDV